MTIPPDNLALDCRIATGLGWTECEVVLMDNDIVRWHCAVGYKPKTPRSRSKDPIPSYSTDIREVIAVCVEREWSFRIGNGYVEIANNGDPQIYLDNNYPLAAALALAGMLAGQEGK